MIPSGSDRKKSRVNGCKLVRIGIDVIKLKNFVDISLRKISDETKSQLGRKTSKDDTNWSDHLQVTNELESSVLTKIPGMCHLLVGICSLCFHCNLS